MTNTGELSIKQEPKPPNINSSRTQTWLNSPKKLFYIYNVLLTHREITRHEWEEKHQGSCFTSKQKADPDPAGLWAASQYHLFLSELKNSNVRQVPLICLGKIFGILMDVFTYL